MPRATVLMTVYNAAPYLQECINSVLTQDFNDFDFWIINDGSTDETNSIISSQTDSRIKRFVNEKNLGIAPSLNLYLGLITSEYIIRMDADDICLPHRFEKQISFMDSNPNIGMSGGALQYFGKKNNIWHPATTHPNIAARLLFNCAIPNPTLIIRTQSLKKHHLTYSTAFPAPPMEDYALLIDSLNLFELGNLTEVLVKHREHEQNQSNQYLNQKQKAMIAIYKRLFKHLNINTSDEQLLLHFRLTYNFPDFKNHSISNFLDWSDFLRQNIGDTNELKKVLKHYLIKLLKHLKFKPISALKLVVYLFRMGLFISSRSFLGKLLTTKS